MNLTLASLKATGSYLIVKKIKMVSKLQFSPIWSTMNRFTDFRLSSFFCNLMEIVKSGAGRGETGRVRLSPRGRRCWVKATQ